MACIDIYQALTEDRPYKKGLSHDKACGILDDMAQKGFVDSDISNKIRDCFGSMQRYNLFIHVCDSIM